MSRGSVLLAFGFLSVACGLWVFARTGGSRKHQPIETPDVRLDSEEELATHRGTGGIPVRGTLFINNEPPLRAHVGLLELTETAEGNTIPSLVGSSVAADERGRFETFAPTAGSYCVHVLVPWAEGTTTFVKEIELREGDDREHELRLSAAKISGRVQTPDGRGVEGIKVEAGWEFLQPHSNTSGLGDTEAGPGTGSTTTGTGGEFTLVVPSGSLSVSASYRPPGEDLHGPPESYASEYVSVGPGEHLSDLTLELSEWSSWVAELRQALPHPEVVERTGQPLMGGSLETRFGTITMRLGEECTLYTILADEGELLAEDVTEDYLAEHHPEIHALVSSPLWIGGAENIGYVGDEFD